MALLHEERLLDIDPVLARIVRIAAKNVSFNVLAVCGYRSYADQLKAYLTGKSKAKPGQSKHNSKPSKAVDLIAADDRGNALWQNLDMLNTLNTAIQKQAEVEKVKVVWSKTWKKFIEFDHWELA